MGVTDKLDLQFPELEDPADVPSDVEILAQGMEAHAGGIVPIGAIIMWFLPTPPADWLFCHGVPIPAGYPDLIALIGANTPDLRDRVPIGVSPSKGVGATGGEARVKLKAAESGIAIHGHGKGTLSIANQAAFNTGWRSHAHSHNYSRMSAAGRGAPFGSNYNTPYQGLYDTVATDTESSDHYHTVPEHGHALNGQPANHSGADAVEDHNNLPPYMALNFIIRGR